MCVLFSLSASLSFFLSETANYIPFTHSQERSAFGLCRSREKRHRGERPKKREEAYRRPRRTDSESSFFCLCITRGKKDIIYNTSKVCIGKPLFLLVTKRSGRRGTHIALFGLRFSLSFYAQRRQIGRK